MSLIIRKKSGAVIRKNNKNRLVIDDELGVDVWFNKLIVRAVVSDTLNIHEDDVDEKTKEFKTIRYFCVWTRSTKTYEKMIKKCGLSIDGEDFTYVNYDVIESCGLKTYEELIVCFEIAGIKKGSGVNFFHANYRN
tara:strand:- start:9325 stop:9732 length:408 start_codon:yes stop_codon:yes gene_type:complete